MINTIDYTNIANESFHNLCKISDSTKYTNPISAFKAHSVVINVTRDDCNNILQVINAIGIYPINLN